MSSKKTKKNEKKLDFYDQMKKEQELLKMGLEESIRQKNERLNKNKMKD
jgi:hypothetical protein|tara:strand:+ start:815 stop:961 length:147 start_codon:yes stop_codon:yes gene_type:complete